MQLVRSLALNLCLTIVASVVALCLGEAAIRIAAPQQLIVKRPDIWKPVEVLGWKHHENVSTSINTGERTVSVFTDEAGFRVGSEGRVEAANRILVLGDSFMEAFQVEYEESLPGVLQTRMPRELGKPIAIRNTGVGAWDPSQYLLQLEQSLQRERYDLILTFFFLGNDIVDRHIESYRPRAPAQVHPFRFPREPSIGELVDSLLYPLNDFLEVRSHLFILLKTQASALLFRLGLTGEYFPPYFRLDEASSERWSVTADIGESIATLAEEHGSDVFFVLLPAHYQIDRTTFYEFVEIFYGADEDVMDPTQPNRLLASELRARGIELFDTLPILEAAHKEGIKLYGDVDSHFTAAGHEVVADAIGPIISARMRKRLSHSR